MIDTTTRDIMEQRYFIIDEDGSGRASSHVYDKQDDGHGQKEKWCKSLCGQRIVHPKHAKALLHERYDCKRCAQILRSRAGVD